MKSLLFIHLHLLLSLDTRRRRMCIFERRQSLFSPGHPWRWIQTQGSFERRI